MSTKDKLKIAIDFDGCLHSYVTPFSPVPRDPPVAGAVDFVNWLIENNWKVYVYSVRSSSSPEGSAYIFRWLKANGFPAEKMTISFGKPQADIYLDDKAYRFTGNFQEVESFINEPSNLKSWNKK